MIDSIPAVANSPNQGPMIAAYYAGDKYVDLVGLDACTDFVDPEHIKGFAEVVQLPKPFGLTEYGPHGPQSPPGDYDKSGVSVVQTNLKQSQ